MNGLTDEFIVIINYIDHDSTSKPIIKFINARFAFLIMMLINYDQNFKNYRKKIKKGVL